MATVPTVPLSVQARPARLSNEATIPAGPEEPAGPWGPCGPTIPQWVASSAEVHEPVGPTILVLPFDLFTQAWITLGLVFPAWATTCSTDASTVAAVKSTNRNSRPGCVRTSDVISLSLHDGVYG